MYRWLLFSMALTAWGQTFTSGSTGADGDLIIATPGATVFNQLPQGGGTVFNFRSIQIAEGSTLKLSGQLYPGSLYFLAQNAVTINGILDLSGGNAQPYGSDVSLRVPATPGPGGYSGGLGAFGTSPGQPGNGPGGGSNGFCGEGIGGSFTGDAFLVPLIGGSGGGSIGLSSGGAGGGAILIASSISITVNGTINANGGAGILGGNSGGGSGGGIRLAAPTIAGNGTISAVGGEGTTCGGSGDGQPPGRSGIVRLEAFQDTFTGGFGSSLGNGQGYSYPIQVYYGTPFNTFLPTAVPAVQVTSIGGIPVSTSPTGSFTTPDVTVNSSAPLLVQIRAQNVPLGTTVTLFIFSENGPDQTITSTGLAGTLASSTATAAVTLPSGFSRGYVKATWTQ